LAPVLEPALLRAVTQALLRDEAGAAPEAIPSTAPSPNVGPPLRILVAEDNAINQKLVRRMLEKRGHLVTLAANGEQALAEIQRGVFDLVLMDVQMPVMDGLEATARIRQFEAAAGTHLPVVALTAHAMKGDRERCLSAGMDAYVSKPIAVQELDEAIGRFALSRGGNAPSNGAARHQH